MKVTTLELDVVANQEGQLIVSHEPYLNPAICRGPNGEVIAEDEWSQYNLFVMPYSEVKKCDCGSQGNPRFPQQEKQAAFKPLLSDLIDEVEKYTANKELPSIRYNIELKSREDQYELSQPLPDEFVDLLLDLIEEKDIEKRVTIQSFDMEILENLGTKNTGMPISFLIELEEAPGVDQLPGYLNVLSYKPQVWSCNFEALRKEHIEFFHAQDIKVIPWTVNDKGSMKTPD